MPVPVSGISPAAMPRLLEVVVELPDEGRRAPARALELADLGAQLEDLGLERVLLRLQLGGRLDSSGGRSCVV